MAKEFNITIDDKELSKQIGRALKANPQETAKAVKDCILDLAGNSAKRAPVDKGDLRNNCRADLEGAVVFENQAPVAGPPPPGLRVNGSVGYSLPYALRQHEELGYNHPKGGEAKFLERPFEERKSRYIKRMEQIPERSLK